VLLRLRLFASRSGASNRAIFVLSIQIRARLNRNVDLQIADLLPKPKAQSDALGLVSVGFVVLHYRDQVRCGVSHEPLRLFDYLFRCWVFHFTTTLH
jgi:hypothetical protein